MKRPIHSIILLLLLFLMYRSESQTLAKWKLEELKTAIRNAKGPTIFNFWATFCRPCVKEIPYFQELVKEYDSAGVKLVLVSLDLPEAYPNKIKSFAAKQGLKAPIRFLDETNADLFCPAVDASWSGSIPATLFINNQTGYRKFFEEQLSKEKAEAEIKEMMIEKKSSEQ